MVTSLFLKNRVSVKGKRIYAQQMFVAGTCHVTGSDIHTDNMIDDDESYDVEIDEQRLLFECNVAGENFIY